MSIEGIDEAIIRANNRVLEGLEILFNNRVVIGLGGAVNGLEFYIRGRLIML